MEGYLNPLTLLALIVLCSSLVVGVAYFTWPDDTFDDNYHGEDWP